MFGAKQEIPVGNSQLFSHYLPILSFPQTCLSHLQQRRFWHNASI